MDMERVKLLLDIIALLSGHPTMKNILAEATNELREINEGYSTSDKPEPVYQVQPVHAGQPRPADLTQADSMTRRP